MTRGTDVSNMKRSYTTAVRADLPADFEVGFEKESDQRYGENPNQPAATYRLKGSSLAELTNVRMAKSGKGGLSATNIMDVTRALDILKFFADPACAVMKHTIPSGFAVQHESNAMSDIYQGAWDADARSAFGSFVVVNRALDLVTAEAMAPNYIEGVVAPDFEEGVMAELEKKKNLRVCTYDNLDAIPKFVGDDTEGLYDIKALPTGRVILQTPYLSSIRGPGNLVMDPMVVGKDKIEHVVARDPTDRELRDLMTSWFINLGVRSNGIVFVKDGVTVAVGSGQQERVGAIEQAIVKAYQKAMDRENLVYDSLMGIQGHGELKHNPLEGAVMSSDAFFPFRDSIDTIARVGVTGVIQPGGSVKDAEVIDAVNEHDMAMVYTLERCFGHF